MANSHHFEQLCLGRGVHNSLPREHPPLPSSPCLAGHAVSGDCLDADDVGGGETLKEIGRQYYARGHGAPPPIAVMLPHPPVVACLSRVVISIRQMTAGYQWPLPRQTYLILNQSKQACNNAF